MPQKEYVFWFSNNNHISITLQAQLAQPEVGDLDVTIDAEQNVLRFQVPVDDALLVQGVQGQEDLCSVESSSLLVEPVLLPQVEKQLSPLHEVQHHVQFLFRLKRVVQVYYERVFSHLLKNVSFGLGVLLQLVLSQGRFIQDFHGE